jgi:hypothetical protein
MSDSTNNAGPLSGNASTETTVEPTVTAPVVENPPRKKPGPRGPRTYGFDFGYPRCIEPFDRAASLIDRIENMGALEKIVLKVLINHGNLQNFAESVFPSEHRIGILIKRSERSVRVAMKNLIEAGYILRQRTRKSRSRFGVSHTFFTPKTAALVQGIPYEPAKIRQGDLFADAFGAFADVLKQSVSGVKKAISHLQDWERHLRAVQDYELVKRMSLPSELLFLLEKGVKAQTLCRWAKELRDSKAGVSLVEIVSRRRWHLEQSKNAGGYLCNLVRMAKRGVRIVEGIWWDESYDIDRGQEIDRRNVLIRKHQDVLYHDPKRGEWYRTTSQGDVRVFRGNPGQGNVPIVGTKSVSWLDEQFERGVLLQVRETDPDPGGGFGVFEALREVLGVRRKTAM